VKSRFGPERGHTEGGEALLESLSELETLAEPESPSEPVMPRWHVLWTHSNCEQLVHEQLMAKGFEMFLPIAGSWSRRGRVRQVSPLPLFRGYLFVHHALDKAGYLAIHRTRGLVRILGERWDRLETVPDSEIAAIQGLVRSGAPVIPYPYLREGQRVRIKRGPFTDVEGILVRLNARKGLLVVSVNLLQQSVAVHLDCTQVEVA
jgi:transcription antitermination factor NusG